MASTTTPTTPSTLLDAVNMLLRAVGSAEVMSLNNVEMDQAAQGALLTIIEQSRVVQREGWHCNTEEGLPLSPGPDGRITVPVNLMAFKVNVRDSSKDVTWRGAYLYDRKNHTPFFNDPVRADVTLLLEFAELPEALRWYVTAKAGRIFGVNRKPDSATYRFTSAVEEEARSAALQDDHDMRDTALPDTSPHHYNMRKR